MQDKCFITVICGVQLEEQHIRSCSCWHVIKSSECPFYDTVYDSAE